MAKIRLKNAGKWVAGLIRVIGGTLRFRVINHANMEAGSDRRHIWVFWHNRMFLIPWIRQNMFPGQSGGFLTSPSGDGAIIADACSDFGLKPVRGSSSRGGAKAMMEMAELLKSGHDLGITPDGPRGPRYRMNMGVIKLAQLTGAMVLPVHVRYDRAVRFKTWDGFLLPLPFSGVEIEFGPSFVLPRRMSEEQCEAERLKLEGVMIEGTHEVALPPARNAERLDERA
jgi:Kdo2-lipid IVA 3' secondary acyltransferase